MTARPSWRLCGWLLLCSGAALASLQGCGGDAAQVESVVDQQQGSGETSSGETSSGAAARSCSPATAVPDTAGQEHDCDTDADPAVAPLACCQRCELAAGGCARPPFSEYPDEAETRRQWQARCSFLLSAMAGRCQDGTRFLSYGTGFTSETRYFDEAGRFLGLQTTTDVIDELCQGSGYWPRLICCEDPLGTEALCAD